MRHVSLALLITTAAWACGDEPQITEPQTHTLHSSGEVTYEIALLPTLEGRLNRPSGINNRGWVAGFANLSDNLTRHAALWRGGEIKDLGTLGGPNSNVQWPGINEAGTVVGIAELDQDDPLDEEWSCTAFFPSVTGKICRGFVWRDDQMSALEPLGGNQSFATSVNNRGQVVGWAETPVFDPTCTLPQRLQFRAVLWEPRKDRQRELPPFPGDSTSAATAINDRGMVVGISGECDVAVGRRSALRSVLWHHGRVIDIGDLGGDMWHTPMDINERGDVVGFSNPAGVVGITFAPHGFFWSKRDGIVDLGTLPGDAVSQAVGINNRRQVVGVSSGPSGNSAVLWENGVPRDLNGMKGDFPHRLIVAQHINDRGVIVGRAVLTGTTTQVPFVATPVIRAP